MTSELLTPAEVAELCRVSIHTVIGWRRHKTGPPAVKVGGRWRYDKQQLIEWMKGIKNE